MLTKTQLLCEYMTYNGFDGYMWSLWFDRRLKDAGVTYNESDRDQWQKMLQDMPTAYTIDISVRDQTVTFEHCDGTDVYPLAEFFDENDGPEVELIERHGYWDGPISGICKFNGVEAYFDMIDEGDIDQNRKYAAYTSKSKKEKLGEFYWFDFKHYQTRDHVD